MGIDGQVVHIEVTPACFAVGVEVAPRKAEGFAGPVIDSLVKMSWAYFCTVSAGFLRKAKSFTWEGSSRSIKTQVFSPFSGSKTV